MKIPENRFKHALARGETQIGLWSNLCSNLSVELLAGAGFDWLVLDSEHSPNEIGPLVAQLQAVAAYPTSAVVRVPWNDMVVIKRYLDVGAQTLLVPYVSTAEEATLAVRHTRYPPAGVRGIAGQTRATRWGRVEHYARNVESELCLLVQAETRTAIENLEAICAVEGVDGVFVGPADLHASYGRTGANTDPELLPVIEDAIRRIRRAGKAPGIIAAVEDLARRWIDCGAQFVAVGLDTGILASGADALARKFIPSRR